MVVDDSHIEGVAIDPAEDDAPLLIDSDAVKPVEVAAQRFEMVARGPAEIIQVDGAVDELQLAQRVAPQIFRKAAGPGAVPSSGQIGSRPISVAPDHACDTVTLLVTCVKLGEIEGVRCGSESKALTRGQEGDLCLILASGAAGPALPSRRGAGADRRP
jgi:hypothetical protein